jgi:hypothetical protein
MKLKLITSGVYYNDSDKKKLEKFGFEFNLNESKNVNDIWTIDTTIPIYIDIKSLEDLSIYIDYSNEVIIGNNTLELYDDYRE